jgi:hypothetical protein
MTGFMTALRGGEREREKEKERERKRGREREREKERVRAELKGEEERCGGVHNGKRASETEGGDGMQQHLNFERGVLPFFVGTITQVFEYLQRGGRGAGRKGQDHKP